MLCPECGVENKDSTGDVCKHCATPLVESPTEDLPDNRGGCLNWKGCLIMFIIGVIFIWAVVYPNYVEVNTVNLKSRVLSNTRTLSTAIEAYFVDNYAYPAWSVGPGSLNGNEYPSFMLHTSQNGLETITTPVAYTKAYFRDPFSPRGKLMLNYFRAEYSWILWSAGPDGDYDIDLNVVQNKIDWNVSQPAPESLLYSYDPTNGTLSSGDIIRFKN